MNWIQVCFLSAVIYEASGKDKAPQAIFMIVVTVIIALASH